MCFNFQVEKKIRKLQQREFEWKRKTFNKIVEIFQEIPHFIKELIWVNNFQPQPFTSTSKNMAKTFSEWLCFFSFDQFGFCNFFSSWRASNDLYNNLLGLWLFNTWYLSSLNYSQTHSEIFLLQETLYSQTYIKFWKNDEHWNGKPLWLRRMSQNRVDLKVSKKNHPHWYLWIQVYEICSWVDMSRSFQTWRVEWDRHSWQRLHLQLRSME